MRIIRVAAIALIAIVLATVADQQTTRRMGLRASAPAASPVTATLPPAAVPSAIDQDHGLVVATRDSLLVRRESDGQMVRELPLYTRALVGYAISPQGRYIAYWARVGEDRQDYELRVYDAATNAEPRVLLRVTSALYLPSSLAWASDETALAYGVVALSPRRETEARPPELRTIDVSSRTVNTLYRAEREGLLLTPLAWDREQRLMGAVEVNDRQVPERYLRVTEDGRVTADALPMAEGPHTIVGLVGDALRGMAAAIDLYTCSGGAKCSGLRAWPIEREFRHATGPASDPGSVLRSIRFVRGSRFVVALANAGARGPGPRLEVIDPVARAQTHVLRAYEGAEREREMFVRPDGGAAYVFELGDAGWTGELVPLDGSPPQRLPRTDLGGRPVASVTLDPKEASRVSALPSLPHLLTRDEIRAAVPRYADVRVDSESYLLTTRGKLEDVFGGRSSEDLSVPVWVVARTGEFTWQGTTGPLPRNTHPPCQVWTFDARTGSTMSYGLGGLSMCAAFASPRASP